MDRDEAGVDAFLFLRLDVGLGGAAVAAFVDERGDERLDLAPPSCASGCSAAIARYVTPISVSGRVVNTVSGSASPFTANCDLEPFRAPDPVALHGLDRIGPARQPVEPFEQFVARRP